MMGDDDEKETIVVNRSNALSYRVVQSIACLLNDMQFGEHHAPIKSVVTAVGMMTSAGPINDICVVAANSVSGVSLNPIDGRPGLFVLMIPDRLDLVAKVTVEFISDVFRVLWAIDWQKARDFSKAYADRSRS